MTGVSKTLAPQSTLSAAANNAAFVSQSVPTTMTPGQSYAISVTMQNTGNTTWSSANQFKLGTQNPEDNTLWTGLTRVALPSSVNPGESVTFNFNVTAPSATGLYNFQWKMVQDGVQWFGLPGIASVSRTLAQTFRRL